ncbi:MAG: hypothetical protein A2X77_04905 [Gammaproteobacteria bacterium GWE2_42_36]|nr:MAG: hypothetical protein A2X77_04905 [Gammaproteobacteria bacterium GWE2_42_36]HCU05386.1 shikimate kinase I [Coxiellaceae bacterium]
MKEMTNNIYLIGPMGAGKTTIGRQLARKLNWAFYDTDHIIEERTGVDLSWLFDIEGEESFHQRERKVLEELSQINQTVISTGGTSVLLPENRTLIANTGLVIYLYTDVSSQIKRTTYNRHHRPQLGSENIPERILELRNSYLPLYESVAHVKFSTSVSNFQTVIKAIIHYLQK